MKHFSQLVRDGHATMIQEIKDDLNGMKPSCFVVSVGGGGLLLGILKGLEATGTLNEWTVLGFIVFQMLIE